MNAHDHALELTDMTGWNDRSIAVLLASFIEEKGLTSEAADWLHKQATEEADDGERFSERYNGGYGTYGD